MEKILLIEEVTELRLGNIGTHTKKARVGMHQMLNALMGFAEYDGYKITTTEREYLILIDNGQCCCESWGYFASEDNISNYENTNKNAEKHTYAFIKFSVVAIFLLGLRLTGVKQA